MSKWLSNMPVRWKVLSAPAFLIVVLMAVGAYALFVQRAAQTAVSRLVIGPITQAEMIADLNTAMWTAQANLYRLTATAANETDQKKVAEQAKQVATLMAEIPKKLEAFEALPQIDQRTKSKLDPLKAAVGAYLKQTKNVLGMVDTDAGSALMFMMGVQRAFTQVSGIADDMTESSKQARDNEIARTNSTFDRQAYVLIGVLLCVVALGCVVSLLVARIIARPVIKIAAAVDRIASGDLDVAIAESRQKDEVGRIAAAVSTMAERVRATVIEIKSSAREVTNASTEIATATTDLSQRTEEQAASLEETSSAMQQLAATVRKNANNADEANRLARDTRAVADRGGAIASKAITAMARIEESSKKVTDILGVIDEIARQTNLLALNAAVEAARAGEAGRGFAVVASEVRSLAQRSSEAAKDIKQLIASSASEVHQGVDLVNQTGTALTEIAASIKQAADVISEIANASTEQATGLDEINKAIAQMDDATQRNSALVEENAATARTLEDQARVMQQRVSFFRCEDGHVAAVAAPKRGNSAAPRDEAALADAEAA